MSVLQNPAQDEIGFIPYEQIKESDYLPTLESEIKNAYSSLEVYLQNQTIDFKNVIEKLDEVSEKIDYISNVFYALHSAHATDGLRDLAPEFSQKLTQFSNEITLNENVFQKIKELYDNKDKHSSSSEQARILDKYYSDFIRNGALLSVEQKTELKAINEELSRLGLKFSDNALQSGNSLYHHVENKDQLPGMPDNLLDVASKRAKDKNLEGYVFSLDYPEFLPFMKLCKNRAQREAFYKLSSKKAFGGEFDNQENVKQIVALRIKRANLLGYKTHADYVLEKRMAGSAENVLSFLKDLRDKSINEGKSDLKKLQDLAQNLDGIRDFAPWDSSFYSEILKKQVLDFDDEVLRPYFELNKVRKGVFEVAKKLFDIEFELITDAPKYHEEVEVYKVTELETGNYIGLFYADMFPRKTKRQGAWMTNLREQGLFQGKVRRPHVSIVCNFTPSSESRPSLLAFYEVRTLFHEFGHALHGLLSKCHYRNLSGTSVYWDFVELPSQLMENWCFEKECLDLFAEHYETGEKIPENILTKIKESTQFLEGSATLRQVSFAMLDMAWHTLVEVPNDLNLIEFETEQMKTTDLLNHDFKSCRSVAFGHLFAGGYSAGYYSYKWAEVLEADVFEMFLQKGIFNKEVALKFKQSVLEKGGTEDPLELFKQVRGREPKTDALMKRAGLV